MTCALPATCRRGAIVTDGLAPLLTMPVTSNAKALSVRAACPWCGTASKKLSVPTRRGSRSAALALAGWLTDT